MDLRLKKIIAGAATVAMMMGSGAALAASPMRDGDGMDKTVVIQDKNLVNYLNEQDAQMEIMMQDMQGILATGNPSIDFLQGMIPHHQAAIDMSKSLLKYGGKNKDVKRIAQDVIRVQTSEIAQMETLIKKMSKEPNANKVKGHAYMQEYNKMFTVGAHKTHGNVTQNNVDAAFVQGMIEHHAMAIDMSQTILKYTNSKEIKKMAKEIIKAQNKEIAEMEALLLVL